MALAPLDPISWLVSSYSWRAADRLTRELGLPRVAATVLAARGLSDVEQVRAFLACSAAIPDPYLFEHMSGTVATISKAVDEGARVVVHGDYDADGITATALMVLALRDLGLEADWYLPSRFAEGYGLSRTAVESIARKAPALLITVDCGVNYPDEVDLARELGLEVVVVDHHQPGPRLPDCHVIHPLVGSYPHGQLCGVGLALKVMHGLHVHRNGAAKDRLPEALHRFLDLVAIGTIADLAPLLEENRYYVKEGLKLIAMGARPGLHALAGVAGCQGEVDSGAVAFRLAPRLNAAGRLAEASPPLRLLLTSDEEEAVDIACKLHELNGARQDVERQILNEAIAQVEMLDELPSIIVLAGETWHEGVVGIVASRLVERYNRPVILLGVRDGVAKGSGRSVGGYDLMQGLVACSQHLTVYGGHPQAVGLTTRAERIEAFRGAIERHAAAALEASDLAPVYRADAVVRAEDVTADTAVALSSLGPFGTGNPRPRLLLVDAEVKRAEATRTGSHLRCTLDLDGVQARAIGFGMGESAVLLQQDGKDRIIGAQMRVDQWQGSLRPEFLLERIGGDAAQSQPVYGCGDGCGHCEWPGTRSGQAGRAAGATGAARALSAPGTSSSGRPCENGQIGRLSLPYARDLRDSPGRWGAVAQVLATGESAIVLGCSVSHSLGRVNGGVLHGALRLDSVCVGRGCWRTGEDRASSAEVLAAEWDAAVLGPALMRGRSHVIAVDPPYRAVHLQLLQDSVDAGAHVHLCYGKEQRRLTAELLRYLVHPRFAMVCLYRAMSAGLGEDEIFSEAAAAAWRQARVMLTDEDVGRARGILNDLGIERPAPADAKIDARRISAYAAAEAEYEECRRLCQIL